MLRARHPHPPAPCELPSYEAAVAQRVPTVLKLGPDELLVRVGTPLSAAIDAGRFGRREHYRAVCERNGVVFVEAKFPGLAPLTPAAGGYARVSAKEIARAVKQMRESKSFIFV